MLDIPSHAPVRGEGASHYLLARWGIPIKASTLGKLRSIGGGPVFRRAGRWPIYEVSDLDTWAESRLSQKARSTSELPPLTRKAA
jgi:hypothetical protein